MLLLQPLIFILECFHFFDIVGLLLSQEQSKEVTHQICTFSKDMENFLKYLQNHPGCHINRYLESLPGSRKNPAGKTSFIKMKSPSHCIDILLFFDRFARLKKKQKKVYSFKLNPLPTNLAMRIG